MMSKPIQEAILLIQIARDKIELEAHYRDSLDMDKQDLLDAADDLGPILHCLESFSK